MTNANAGNIIFGTHKATAVIPTIALTAKTTTATSAHLPGESGQLGKHGSAFCVGSSK